MKLEELTALAEQVALREGSVEGVTFVRHYKNIVELSVRHQPCAVFVVQGRKQVVLGKESLVYDPHHYLVLTTPVPFVADDYAMSGEPVIAVCVHLRRDIILELLGTMQWEFAESVGDAPKPFESVPLDEPLADTLIRLLRSLHTPEESKVLAPSLIREIAYRVLKGAQGPSLRASMGLNGHFARINRVLRRLHENFTKPVSIEELASSVGMSLSVFHLHFRSVTSTSPLQYIKSLRLHRARTLMLDEGIGVAEVSQRVGYESATQFSREYKRYFGHSPTSKAQRSDQSRRRKDQSATDRQRAGRIDRSGVRQEATWATRHHPLSLGEYIGS